MPPRGLQREVGKARPFDLPEQEAFLNLQRTTSLLAGELVALFREHGISDSGYNVLRILRGAGPRGRTCGEIGRDMVVRVPDVTRLVDRLAAEGLVERTRSAQDRRVVRVVLTRAGRALLRRLDQPVLDAHEAQLGHMPRRELTELIRLLEKARAGYREPEPGGG